MLEEELSRGEKLYLRRFMRKMNPGRAAAELGVSLDQYLKWESDEEVGPDVEVALIPANHYTILRFRAGWTMKRLAEEMGCSASLIKKMERGIGRLDKLIEFWGH